MGTYIVGDIHGCYDSWIQLKNKIEKLDSNANFIFVGDVIDRGPKSLEMIRWCMDNITEDGKYQMVIGNHEVEKISWWTQNIDFYKYIEKVNNITNYDDIFYYSPSNSYDFDLLFKNFEHPGLMINEIIEWFQTLDYYKDIVVNNQRFLIAHANIPYSIINKNHGFSLKKDLTESDKDFIIWDRDVGDFNKIPDTILINGHTPTISCYAFQNNEDYMKYSGRIFHTHNRYNVDCGLVFKSSYKDANLAALRLDDFKEFYLYKTV